MSRGSTKSKSYQVRSHLIAIVSRNTTFRWRKNYATCCPSKCPQAENCRSKFGCSQDRPPAQLAERKETIYCPGVHLDSLQTMANLACGTGWDACLAPGCVDRVLERDRKSVV